MMSIVSVIIPTWNARERLVRCLEALCEQTRSPDQVIVVDNKSTDGTVDMIRNNYSWINLVSLPENRGTSGGVNAGLRVAKGDYIATLDSDAYPTQTWLEALVNALESQPAYSFAACRLLLADRSGHIDSAGDGFDIRLGGVMLGEGCPNGSQFDYPREVFSATGAASMYRKEVFQTVNGLDESLFIYSDDVDLGFRARLRGFRCVYVPDAVVYHERSATFGRNSPTQIRLMYRNGLTVYLKNMPWPLIRPIWLQVLRAWAGVLCHAPYHSAALRGVIEALWRLPGTLSKRRQIQRTRTVSLEQLHTAMITGSTQFEVS